MKVMTSPSARMCTSPAPTILINCEGCSLVCCARRQSFQSLLEVFRLNQDQDTNRTETNSEEATEVPVKELPLQESDVPLFLRDSSDGDKGDAQDEKDKTAE